MSALQASRGLVVVFSLSLHGRQRRRKDLDAVAIERKGCMMTLRFGTRSESQFRDTGFIRFNPAEQLDDINLESALEGLRQDFADLPPDPYGQGRHRYRRYARAVLISGERESGLVWLPSVQDEQGTPVSEYYQADFNPEYIDARRQFPTLTEHAKNNPLLRHLIRYDWALTF